MAIEQKINYADFVTPGRQAFDTGQRALSQYGTLADMAGLRISKDIAIEERAQEAERLRLAAEQRKMLQGAKDKAKKQSTLQTILSLAGTAGGAYLGALSGVPGGMTAGAQLGGSLGGGFSSLFANQGGLVPNYIPAPTNFYTGGEVPGPTGKFNKSNYEELRRIQELIADQEKAIARAQKPSAGRFFEGVGKGYDMGSMFGDFLEGDLAQGIFKKGKEKLDAFKLSRELAKSRKNPMEMYYKERKGGTKPIQTTGFMKEGQLFEKEYIADQGARGRSDVDIAGEIIGRIGEVGQTIPGRIEGAKQSFGFIENMISKNKAKQAKKRLDKLPQNTEQAVVQYLAGQKNPNEFLSNAMQSGSNVLQDFIAASRQPRRQVARGASTLKDFLYVSPEELGLSRSALETYPNLFMDTIAPNRNRNERMIQRSQTAGFR